VQHHVRDGAAVIFLLIHPVFLLVMGDQLCLGVFDDLVGEYSWHHGMDRIWCYYPLIRLERLNKTAEKHAMIPVTRQN
jgi:hypothetical protein